MNTPCSIASLEMFLNEGVSYVLNNRAVNGMVLHHTRATLSCTFPMSLSGSSETTCFNGEWMSSSERSCNASELPRYR